MGKLIQFLTHPAELYAAVQLKGFRKTLHPQDLSKAPATLKECYRYLNLTSRSFAAVIQELHPELRDAVMLFYMVLRALDTMEDDMTLDPAVKVPLLRTFHEKLALKEYLFTDLGPNEKDRVVLVGFTNILVEYHKLKPAYQDIIRDMTEQMGNGMADYIVDDQFNLLGVQTLKDFDLYCHYVAGLVGEGLTRLMALAGFADDDLVADGFAKCESMGLFLQKTNIIRDYNEDMHDGRSFYPKEVWSKYTAELPLFYKNKAFEQAGVWCINELVLNSLGHAKDVLSYLSLVRDPSSFSFCAIPQVMAIANLDLVYNNKTVLYRNVKIRKGTTVLLILESRTLPGVVRIFRRYIKRLNNKADVNDPNYFKMGLVLGEIEQFCDTMYPRAVPAGVIKRPQEINEFVARRGDLDATLEALYSQETAQLNAILLAVALAVAGAVYAVI